MKDIATAADWIRKADALLIGAGAGMGVDSGLPDFRGNEGFWKAYPPLAQAKIQFVEIANPHAFSENPPLAWGFYGHRLQLYRDTIPHHGFHLLKKWAEKMKHGAFVFTSNVDGQFQKAGFPDDRILECHGSIHHLQCTRPCSNSIWEANQLLVDIDMKTCQWQTELPKCKECGDLARPNILLFNDYYWVSDRTDKQTMRFKKWLNSIENLVVIELGAGLAVPTVRRLCESIPAPFIRINPTDAQMDSHRKDSLSLSLKGLEALEQIQAAL